MYDAQFSMGHSLLDFCLKEKEKKSSQRKQETSIGSKREEGKVHSEKGRINCTRKASVNTTG